MRPDTTTAAVKPSRDRLSAGRRPLQVHFALLIAAFVSVAAAVAELGKVVRALDGSAAGLAGRKTGAQ